MSTTSSILAHLNPSQQEAVTFGEGPLLILAGPGSGKTRALTYRAAWLIKEKKINPENILLLTFTNKAAGEMKNRIKKLVETKPPFAGTFHSFCARVLRVDGKHIGIPNNYLIYDGKDQLDTIKMTMDKIDISPEQIKPISALKTISQAKSELIPALEYPQYARGHFQETVARIYLVYQQLLKKHKALDFDDLLLETNRLFQKERKILNKYQNRFCYVLVDEYQDTNHAQYMLTRHLSGKWRNLCVVGDASQAIYGFRGANYRNLLSLKNDFPNLTTFNLERNYRSTKVILKAANEVIRKNTNHPILKLWTDNKNGEQISIFEAHSESDEANFVVKTIGEHLFQSGGISPSDFAILYRTNAQSRVLEEAFLHAGVPYSLVGGIRFYERKEIKDCLAYLKFLANPQDMISFQRIEKLGKKRLNKFLMFTKKAQANNPSSLELLDKILKVTDYLKLYDGQDEKDLARLENIKELRSVATEFPNLTNFLENVVLMEKKYLPPNQSLQNTVDEKQTVTLMTAHAAKGTEFPIVFIVGLEEGLFPHSRSLIEKEGIEEERRLFYVGMTRAKKKLYLSHARRRLYFGQRSTNPPSRFINEIPEELIDSINGESATIGS